MKKIVEIKRHLNKPDEYYHCDLVREENDGVVLKYISEKPGRVGEMTFEIGSTTYAYYRNGAGFVLWKMCGPDGRPKGYLFHICRDLRVKQDRVEYTDLLLDLWISQDGALTVLDRDELEACAATGVISGQDLAWIAHHEQEITKGWQKMISPLQYLA